MPVRGSRRRQDAHSRITYGGEATDVSGERGTHRRPGSGPLVSRGNHFCQLDSSVKPLAGGPGASRMRARQAKPKPSPTSISRRPHHRGHSCRLSACSSSELARPSCLDDSTHQCAKASLHPRGAHEAQSRRPQRPSSSAAHPQQPRAARMATPVQSAR
eukprot:scaffold51480_cov33-Tisochrysis_lutea.AAC.2